MNEITLIVARHGETLPGGAMGQSDRPLSPHGAAQAQELAARLEAQEIHTFYTSDLGRTVQTAEAIAKTIRIPFVPDERLRERDIGVLTGLTESECREKHPEVLAGHDEHGESYVIPEGESGQQHMARVGDFLDEVSGRSDASVVLAVTHGGTLRCLLRHVLGFSYHSVLKMDCDNAGVSVFRWNGTEWILVSWNETWHLSAPQDQA